jgi:hypothetical protein
MQIDGIKGHRLTDIESEMYIMYESDRAFQKVVDALNEIGCTSFTVSEKEIEQMLKDGLIDGRCIKIDSLRN